MGKLDMAREFGVDGIILNDSPEGFDKAVKEITDGNGFDIAIEAVGLPSHSRTALTRPVLGERWLSSE